MTTPLSVALRDVTAAAHKSAETSSFITELLAGRACYSAFTTLVAQQLVIYQALETVLHEHYLDHPLIAAVDDRRLDRVHEIERDLTALSGPDFDVRLADGSLPIREATAAYAETLREEHSAEMILANHYVRYLGDLSGGQAVARLAQRHYAVPDEALHFYRFEGIDKLKVYKDHYRSALDSIVMTNEQRERTLDHAVHAFGLNEAVFADLTAAKAPLHTAAGVAG